MIIFLGLILRKPGKKLCKKGPSRDKSKELVGDYDNKSTRKVPEIGERKGGIHALSLHTILYIRVRQRLISRDNRKMRRLSRNIREKR